jgi:eukaryotic-like serine/threonine-protein kinase
MRVLIVDDNPDFRMVLAECLAEGAAAAKSRGEHSDAVIEAKPWDPVRGVPDAKFAWGRINAVLLNYELGPLGGVPRGIDNPFVWLSKARAAFAESTGKRKEEFPPTVLVTGRGVSGNGDILLRAAHFGITDCIARVSLSPAKLYVSVRNAMDERQSRKTIEKSMRTGTFQPFVNPMEVGQALRRDADLPHIAGYELVRKLGEGGTAQVYLAMRHSPNNSPEEDSLLPPVVLKVMDKAICKDPHFLERFMQEFSVLQKIKSEYVTRIFDFGYDNGHAYLALEFFGAGDLKMRIKEGVFPPVQALKVLGQLARALGAIHDAGVVHRDLKPQNVMFRDAHHLAIVDFGAAKNLEAEERLTQIGHIVGTPMYMSPEQVMNKKISGQSDLYSLGVIFHQLLTGRPLYQANNAAQMMDMHISSPIPSLPENLNGFQPILDRLVAKLPQDRFENAHEVYRHILI